MFIDRDACNSNSFTTLYRQFSSTTLQRLRHRCPGMDHGCIEQRNIGMVLLNQDNDFRAHFDNAMGALLM